ncbi:MAG: hypothetical protein LBI43_03570 [Streptococcaceae bacterium]|jgi:hypothetical protein|nr:hypothetical protein [Streptococcaceae bacterium]
MKARTSFIISLVLLILLFGNVLLLFIARSHVPVFPILTGLLGTLFLLSNSFRRPLMGLILTSIEKIQQREIITSEIFRRTKTAQLSLLFYLHADLSLLVLMLLGKNRFGLIASVLNWGLLLALVIFAYSLQTQLSGKKKK